MEYPEAIYDGLADPQGCSHRLSEVLVERSYNLGYGVGHAKGLAERPDPLAGYSNLTAAISAGEPIDWERLDGLKTQCVNHDVGTNRGTLERRESVESDSPDGWWKSGMDFIYVNALIHSWQGEDGWTLWIEGDIPLVRKTADQLEVGIYFLGESEWELYVGEKIDGSKIVRHVPKMEESLFDPSEWVVLEEYGTFQKPEDK